MEKQIHSPNIEDTLKYFQFDVDNTIYLLSITLLGESNSIKVISLLRFSLYNGKFSFQDLIKLQYFINFQTLGSIQEELKEKILKRRAFLKT